MIMENNINWEKQEQGDIKNNIMAQAMMGFIKTGHILPVKEYNRLGEIRWGIRCKQVKKSLGTFAYMHGHQPNLCFYIFDKKYGYVLKTERGSIWRKTKKELLLIKNK
tara:strand:- start:1475 stop:1798 length:324 start_codon:yes stop_codon:yes gene_type:complete